MFALLQKLGWYRGDTSSSLSVGAQAFFYCLLIKRP
ncbi:hypothetical protein CLOLEP_02089 [[Clostridium] leptum DSM 753]|uniref:Uncharacterized protein n=1 Tax=[Clostridium] leptum DSM 753 TaxID=428125 RepID=A7VU43_9FIRM|nr:hypothetical protein CLOLEP_02089 [[Clostridium] leptum DSM 753]